MWKIILIVKHFVNWLIQYLKHVSTIYSPSLNFSKLYGLSNLRKWWLANSQVRTSSIILPIFLNCLFLYCSWEKSLEITLFYCIGNVQHNVNASILDPDWFVDLYISWRKKLSVWHYESPDVDGSVGPLCRPVELPHSGNVEPAIHRLNIL